MRFLRQRPGLIGLLVILTIISIGTIKPDFYLLGWDNYSSYFNLPTNIFRTFFSSWRAYRGLGVPSDAEVTDIFRQVFYWLAHFIVPVNLLDQAYYVGALWVGVLSMYACGRLLIKDFHFARSISDKSTDFFAFLTALFYLFNLNTLSVFYSPIIPFTNRFYSLPLTIYVFLTFLASKNKKISFLLLAFTIIVTSGSYITPTVLITNLIAFLLFMLVRLKLKTTIIYSLVFLSLNSFWVLPFLSYTLQKSAIIPLARTFIEINESTLNKSASAFSLDKQAILFPSFFDLSFHSLSGQRFPIHPLLSQYTESIYRYILFLFPIFYTLGSLLILLSWKKNKKSLWIALWIGFFLFLSLKEFSPLGFLYIWMKQTIPLFDVLFRIADTKFHAYISFAGSLAGAYAFVWIFSLIQSVFARRTISVIVVLLGATYLSMFRSYFTGDLIGFFSYSKVPSQYFEMAQMINAQPGYGRVLHLPMDIWYSYWRSFSWGYIGSSFFHYFIDKPYIDKTFEPASLENSLLHGRIQSLIDSFYRSNIASEKEALAQNFLQLLQSTGTQYILLDESISSSMYARNMRFDARQWYVQANEMLEYLGKLGFLSQKAIYTMPLRDLYPAYQSLYPSRLIGSVKEAPNQARIVVYEVPNPRPIFELVSASENIDPHIVNLLDFETASASSAFIQDSTKPAQLWPFRQQNHRVKSQDRSFTIDYPTVNTSAVPYSIATTPVKNDSYFIDVYLALEKNKLTLNFSHRYYPDINRKQFSTALGSLSFVLPTETPKFPSEGTILSDWNQDQLIQIIDQYRLRLNDIITPIPADLSGTSKYIGSYMLHEPVIRASILTKAETVSLDASSFLPADSPSCFGPAPTDYEGNIRITEDGSLEFMAKKGSTCAQTLTTIPSVLSGSRYTEIELKLHGMEDAYTPQAIKRSKSIVAQAILKESDPTVHGYVCLREGSISHCLNSHRNIRVSHDDSTFRIPLRSDLTPFGIYYLDIGLVNPNDTTQTMKARNINYHIYSEGEERDLAFSPVFPETQVDIDGPLSISFPKAISTYSYMHDSAKESFYYPLGPCRPGAPGQRTVKYIKDLLFSDMANCSTHVAQWFRYAPDRPYLFAYEYWLGSGQQPSIVMGRDGDNYFFERASLFQGYPNIPGMKQFQDPRPFDSVSAIQAQLRGIIPTKASRVIEPLFYGDSGPADTAIHIFQDTASSGIMAVGAFDMVELPASWYELKLIPESSSRSYENHQDLTYTQLLPSVWKIDGPIEKGIMRFSQGFDAEWGIYDSVWALIGGKTLAPSVKCDGFANCFELPGSQDEKTYYVFYAPERLSFLGWLATLATVFAFWRFFVITSRRAS